MSIYIKLSGGLGNQLFQYALGKSLSIKNSCSLYLDTTWYQNIPSDSTAREILLKDLNIDANFIDSEGACEKIIEKTNWFQLIRKSIRSEKTYYQYDHTIAKLKPPIYLDGYWQSYKYFEDIRKQLLKEITPKIGSRPSYATYEALIKKSKNPIAIHIRRGDYITSQSASKIHGVLSVDYYKNAIEEMKKRTHDQTFFFFSDDINWVKKQFERNNNFHFIEAENKQESVIQELHLMSICKNYIIANSSLSWWGAWLGTHQEKLVITPRKWMTNLDSLATDLIPEQWILLG